MTEAAGSNATRLFFGPTGRSLGRGKVYLGVYEFIMPFVQVGLTDRFSIGGGTPLVFGIWDGDRPFWVTPKLQVLSRGGTDVAVGAFHVLGAGEHSAGIGYVVGTHGSANGSITAGAGLGYAGGNGRTGIVMVGAERRIGRTLRLMTENYMWDRGSGIASAGIRFSGDRLSADLALGIPIGTDAVYAFPVVNFVYAF